MGIFERLLGTSSLGCLKAPLALIITSKFLLCSHHFLLKVIGANNLKPFLFHAHFRSMQKLLPPRAITCVSPFEQLAKEV
jgi:hypothetical protein